jgi:hypothetical protein
MNSIWPQIALLRVASLLAPRSERPEWLREWRSELWYVPPREATTFSLGAFRDAFWLRRNNLQPRDLESPGSCLALLAAIAAISTLVAICLLQPLGTGTTYWRLHVRDLPATCVLSLVYTAVFLAVIRFVVGPPGQTSSAGKLRRAAFFAAKTALVQPIMLCWLFLLVLISRVAPPVAPLATGSMWISIARWLILDQRRRCPVCLRLLANPVRIGAPSNTLLHWYGVESVCSRGHGFLQVPEVLTSYSGNRRWLRLA